MNSQNPAPRTNEKQSDQPPVPKPSSPPDRKAKAAAVSANPAPIQAKSEPAKSARFDKVGSAEGFHSPQSSADKAKEITFRFEAPAAREVLLAADFTNWDKNPIKLMKGGGGVWHTKLALQPGRHLYRFLVDGQWHDDPHCASSVPNAFGSANSVVEIT